MVTKNRSKLKPYGNVGVGVIIKPKEGAARYAMVGGRKLVLDRKYRVLQLEDGSIFLAPVIPSKVKGLPRNVSGIVMSKPIFHIIMKA